MSARISEEGSARAARLRLGNPIRSYPEATPEASMLFGLSLVVTVILICLSPPLVAIIVALAVTLALLALLIVLQLKQRVWVYEGGLLSTALSGKVQFALRWADIRSVQWQQYHVITPMSLFLTLSRTEFTLRVAKGHTVGFDIVKQRDPDELGNLIEAKRERQAP